MVINKSGCSFLSLFVIIHVIILDGLDSCIQNCCRVINYGEYITNVVNNNKRNVMTKLTVCCRKLFRTTSLITLEFGVQEYDRL